MRELRGKLRGILKNRRGIVGIEAAIVLIAFIIIAAALSYVVINMGFYTTQKTKETMQTGLEESLSALQLDGSVIGKTNGVGHIEWVIIPVKLSAGKGTLDLNNESLIVSVYLPNATLLDIYEGVVHSEEYGTDIDILIGNLSRTLGMNTSDSAVFVTFNADVDPVLESSEKAFLIIHLNETISETNIRHSIADYETFKIEVKGAKGAALTVVRTAPGGMAKDAYIDLG